MGVLIITHYQRILHLVHPAVVHVMFEGRIVKEAATSSSSSSRSGATAGSRRRSGGGLMALTAVASVEFPILEREGRPRLSRLRGARRRRRRR